MPLVSSSRSCMVSFSCTVCISIAVKFLYTPKLTLAISTTQRAITDFLCVPTFMVRTFFSFTGFICFSFFLNINCKSSLSIVLFCLHRLSVPANNCWLSISDRVACMIHLIVSYIDTNVCYITSCIVVNILPALIL